MSWAETRARIASHFKNDWMHQEYLDRHHGELNKTVVAIPARSSSIRFPDKNVTLVKGHPLIAYSIRLALKIPGVDRVIVNTDSERYAAIAREYGAETPFIRPRAFAHERSGLAEAHIYLQCYLFEEDYPLRSIVTLLPTSPLRNLQRMATMVKKLDSIFTVSSVMPTSSHMAVLLTRNGSGFVPFERGMCAAAGASFKTLGTFQGINNVESLKEDRKFAYYPITDFLECLDIDMEQDMIPLRHIIDNSLYDFGCDLWQ